MDLYVQTNYGKCHTPAGLGVSLRKEPRLWLRVRLKLALRIPEGCVFMEDYRGLGRWRWIPLSLFLVVAYGVRRAWAIVRYGWDEAMRL